MSSVMKRNRQVVAQAWRTMLVTASRRARERAVSSAAERCAAVVVSESRMRVTPAASKVRRGFDFGTEAVGAVAADGFADFIQSGAGDAFDIGDFIGGAGVIAGVVAVDETLLGWVVGRVMAAADMAVSLGRGMMDQAFEVRARKASFRAGLWTSMEWRDWSRARSSRRVASGCVVVMVSLGAW